MRKSVGASAAVGTVAALAVGTAESEAVLTVTGPLNLSFTSPPGGMGTANLDIAGFGGAIDFVFQSTLNSGSTLDFVRMGEGAGARVVGSTYSADFNYVTRLNAGDVVSSGLNFLGPDGGQLDSYLVFADSSAYPDAGDWLGGGLGYIGISIEDGGQVYYGWIEITVDANNAGATISRYAIETEPGVAVITGIPEPSSLACLAVGAAGLLGWRQRRKIA